MQRGIGLEEHLNCIAHGVRKWAARLERMQEVRRQALDDAGMYALYTYN